MEDIKRNIGQRIKARLDTTRAKQSELAKYAGIAPSSLSQIIAGDKGTSVDRLAKIADFLNVTLDYLITGKERLPIAPQPTKEDALLLAVTSDPVTLEKIKDKLRHQIREETPAYTTALTSNETRLLKAFALLDARRQERLIDTAEDMSVALLRGSGQEEERRGENCARSNGE